MTITKKLKIEDANKGKVIVEEGESDEDVDVDTDSNKQDSNLESDEISNDSEGDSVHNMNKGWVDSIGKILKSNKPKGKRTLVLSRAKKISDVKKAKLIPAGYQIETKDGVVKNETIVAQPEKVRSSSNNSKSKNRQLPNLRVKPNILDKDRERILTKIATKGVVQLFNVVRTQQKDVNVKLDKAGPLDVKKDKVLKSVDKRVFLDVLMSKKSEEVEPSHKQSTERDGEESTWNVLRDDFMMSAKLKDWDKEFENEVEKEKE